MQEEEWARVWVEDEHDLDQHGRDSEENGEWIPETFGRQGELNW